MSDAWVTIEVGRHNGLDQPEVMFRHVGEQDQGAAHFESVRLQLLGSVLDDAHHGRLGRDWRSGITVEERRPGTPTIYTDGDRLAVERIRLMPPAK